MKRILITGANSYIGTSFEKWVAQWLEKYTVDTVDMVDGSWKKKDFSKYDVVFHVAGIAHVKETKQNKELYYKVNRDLAYETARKAKSEGVEQFIFLSSMSVYGLENGVIDKDTIPNPKSNYGKSKKQAEDLLSLLSDDTFKVTVLRPPMVYGKDCKGNFLSLVKLVSKYPIFPSCKNQRSMIHIDNLCAFIKLLIDREVVGVFFPQNKNYMQTTQLAYLIAEMMGKKVHLSIIAGLVVCILRIFLPAAKKAFGSLIYKDTEEFDYCYCVIDIKESVKASV